MTKQMDYAFDRDAPPGSYSVFCFYEEKPAGELMA